MKSLKLNDKISLYKICEIVERRIEKIGSITFTKNLAISNNDDLSAYKKKLLINRNNKEALLEAKQHNNFYSKEIKQYLIESKQFISDKKISNIMLKDWNKLSDNEKFIDLEIKYGLYKTPDGKRIGQPDFDDRILFDFSSTFRDIFNIEHNRIRNSNSHISKSSVIVDYNDVKYISSILEQSIKKSLLVYKDNINKPGAVKITENDYKLKVNECNNLIKAINDIYPVELARLNSLKQFHKTIFLSKSSNPIKEKEFAEQYKTSLKYLDNLKSKYNKNIVRMVNEIVENVERINNFEIELHKHKKEMVLSLVITNSLNQKELITNAPTKAAEKRTRKERGLKPKETQNLNFD